MRGGSDSSTSPCNEVGSMKAVSHISSRPTLQVAVAYIIAQAFYLLTLAPTVLWGDDAKFQRQAYLMDLASDHACEHPLWVLLAHPFTNLPIGDVAYRVNFFSSLCAALAVAVMFATLAKLTKSGWAAAMGAGGLAVSHTFWTHAVRTEVYSLNMLLLAIAFYSLLRARLDRRWLLLSAIAVGLAVDNHVMMWLAILGLGLLAIWRVVREKIAASAWLPALILFALVVGAYDMILGRVHGVSLNVGDYVPTAKELGLGLAMFAVYMVMQFPSPALVVAVTGVRRSFRFRPLAVCLLLILVANVGAVMRFRTPDTYVFYMLAYFVCAFWIALGSQSLLERLGPRSRFSRRTLDVALLLATVAMPVVVYIAAPRLLPRVGITGGRLGIREIPGRPALEYFLLPSKRGYLGARNFAEAALNELPGNAAIIADHTLLQPMLYLQAIEKARPDVHAVEVFVQDQVAFALTQSRERPVYLARTEPYYDLDGLKQHFKVVPQGVVFRLVPIAD
ncbi:MAG: DUF2723 domain-containing protein [Candidatus Eisenbacteria bacterium]